MLYRLIYVNLYTEQLLLTAVKRRIGGRDGAFLYIGDSENGTYHPTGG